MGAVSYTEMYVSFSEAEILEKGIGHIQIIMLASMNDNRIRPALLF
jgi:hypothetical protein